MSDVVIEVISGGKPEQLTFPLTADSIDIAGAEITSVKIPDLSKMESLVKFQMTKTSVETIDLRPLAKCPILREIDLSRNKLREVDLRSLVDIIELAILHLQSNELISIELQPLSRLTNLVELDVSRNQLTSIILKPLSACENLETLNVSSNPIKQLSLAPLGKCRRLRSLILEYNKIASLSLGPLRRCRYLRILIIRQEGLKKIDLTPLEGCTQLESFTLMGGDFDTLDLVPLSGCTELERLILANNHLKTIKLNPLSSLQKLSYLSLRQNDLTKIDLKPISTCFGLKTIYLSDNKLKAINLKHLSKCGAIETLGLANIKLKSIDLFDIITLKKLKRLFLHENPFDELDLYPLRSCSKLAELSLGSSLATGTGTRGYSSAAFNLSPLYHCPQLEEISIHGEEKYSLSNPPSSLARAPLVLLELRDDSRRVPCEYRDAVCQSIDTNGWSKIWSYLIGFDRGAKPDERDRIRWNSFNEVGLGAFVGYDGDLPKFFKPEFKYNDGHAYLQTVLLRECKKQLDSGGSTLFFREDMIKDGDPKVQTLADHLAKARVQEIQGVTVLIYGKLVDLRPLWLTGLGFQILSNLGLWLVTDGEGLELVKKRIKSAGHELRIERSDSDIKERSSRPITQELIFFILDIASSKTPADTKNEMLALLGDSGRIDIVESLSRELAGI